MDALAELKNFCAEGNRLLCFGTEEYACIATAYLETEGMSFHAYGSTEALHYKTLFQKPVVQMDAECLRGAHTVVAVDVRFHDHADIRCRLLSLGVREQDIFFVSRELFFYLRDLPCVTGKAFALAITEHRGAERAVDMDFAAHVQSFDRIEVRFWAHTFGSVQMEMIYYASGETLDRNTYYLLYPARGIDMDLPMTFPNTYMISSFHGENYSVLSPEMLSTWKYILQSYEGEIVGNMDHPLRNRMDAWQMKKLDAYGRIDVEGQPTLEMRPGELERGKTIATEYGIKEPFILIFSRESRYVKEEVQGNHHLLTHLTDDAREVMDMYRNSRISHYIPLIDAFAERSVQVVRFGRFVEDTLQRDNLVDYPTMGATDFMDFYLSRQCKFIIGDSSGAIMLSALYQTPSVTVNVPQVSIRYDGVPAINKERDLMIFQKLYDSRNDRYLSLKEVLHIENEINAKLDGVPGTWQLCRHYREHGVAPVKNSSEDILAVATEMLDKIQGRAVYNEEDKRLQERYEQIVDEHLSRFSPYYILQARVGRDWLRENADWFLA